MPAVCDIGAVAHPTDAPGAGPGIDECLLALGRLQEADEDGAGGCRVVVVSVPRDDPLMTQQMYGGSADDATAPTQREGGGCGAAGGGGAEAR